MKEILIRVNDEKVNSVINLLKDVEIESIDEVITFDEAKKRVAKAVEEYRSGKMKLIDDETFWKEMDEFFKVKSEKCKM